MYNIYNGLGLYYLGSRYYDANIGRFISPDDIGYLGANGDLNAYNLYAYCGNNPVMYSDPSGHLAISTLIIIALIGCGAGFAATMYVDYSDDGEVFNSIDASDYVVNTLVVGLAAVTAGYAASLFGGSAIASPVLASGYAVSISSAQAAVVGTSAVAGMLFFANRSKKEMATDRPGWVNKDMVNPNLSAQENAKRILNERYGVGNWKKGPSTEFNKIVKWITRKLFYKR